MSKAQHLLETIKVLGLSNERLVLAAIQGAIQGATTSVRAVTSGWKVVPIEPTPEMVKAYLDANDAYWKRTDELPEKPGKWRQGTPADATAESYRAMLAASPEAAPAAMEGDYPPLPEWVNDMPTSGFGPLRHDVVNTMRAYVDADRKERQLSACNFCLSQAAEARAAPSAATHERKALIAAHNAIEGLIAWDARRDYPVPYKVRDPLHEALNLARAARAQPAPVQQPHAVPDSVWEALQRLIENAASLGPASHADALLVAKYRDRARFMAAPVQQDAPAPSMVGDALTVIGYTSPGSLHRLVEHEDDSLIVDEESLEGRDVPVYAAISGQKPAEGEKG